MGNLVADLSSAGAPAPAVPSEVVEVKRSSRRVKTVHATWRDGRIVVSIPSWFTPAQEAEWVERMVRKLRKPSRGPRQSDEHLAGRAAQLAATYLPGNPTPASIRWVTNQGRRWGSCTPATGEIRISHRIMDMPEWVVDYVLLHELNHLAVPGHGRRFWDRLERYPHLERAKAYLQGVSYGWDHSGAAPQQADDRPEIPW